MVSDKQIIALKEAENLKLSQEVAQLKHELAQLKKMIFGSRSEKFKSDTIDPMQLSLFDDHQPPQEAVVEEEQTITYQRKKAKKHPGRNEIPEHFEVEQIVIEPEEDTTDMVKVGEVVTEYVEYSPPVLKKIRIVRPKYAPKGKEGRFAIAELPTRALPKSIASESLLSWLIVRKLVEHMPFYRQRQALKRDHNWDLSASTINDWFINVCTLLDPLYELLKKTVLDSGYIQVDESPIKVMDSDKKGSTHKGYQWVYHSPEESLLFFDYRKGRGVNGPKEILNTYEGLLQSDGYGVYDKIAVKQGIKLAGCLVHARRYFAEAQQNDPQRSKYALTIFSKIYEHESKMRLLESDERYDQRQQRILPLVVQLKEWIEQECVKVLPKSAIGKAMTYAQNQMHKLLQVFEDGRYELDNNLIENKIRPLALGRKNYLFAGSHDGAKRLAMMYSFFGSCAANEINPSEWLTTTLTKINDTKLSELHSLLPKTVK